MANRARTRLGVSLRGVIVVLVLTSHFLCAFGFPLPARSPVSDYRNRPFPCQSQACGCLTSEECWKGDCCCYTLEEKLAWADAREIEPPAHVRPMVEARKGSTAAIKNACCSEDKLTPDKQRFSAERRARRWVVGVFAQNCRGNGPASRVQMGPNVVLNTHSLATPDVGLSEKFIPHNERIKSIPIHPPTPPPRVLDGRS
jgi:hypothetical protein